MDRSIRKNIWWFGILALTFSLFGSVRAQTEPDEVIGNLERAMKENYPGWYCSRVHTPQGEPGPESPRGNRYQFRCRRQALTVTILILYGESKLDAEKALDWSQRLQINESKPVIGLGEQGYQLAKERFAWITFRQASVYAQINVGFEPVPEADGPSDLHSIGSNVPIDAATSFARFLVDHLPAPEQQRLERTRRERCVGSNLTLSS
ncbi:MAG TPA: hypothetical protein VLB68_19280 [Pyrinomonadaceae bacterium]|nr:hypothetical protein [Pyrinomonadaceae bacterium]